MVFNKRIRMNWFYLIRFLVVYIVFYVAICHAIRWLMNKNGETSFQYLVRDMNFENEMNESISIQRTSNRINRICKYTPKNSSKKHIKLF